jgi:hypothetical protein
MAHPVHLADLGNDEYYDEPPTWSPAGWTRVLIDGAVLFAVLIVALFAILLIR